MVTARRTIVAVLAVLMLVLAGCVERVSVGSDEQAPNGDSWAPAISANGRFVAFSTAGDNLDTEDTGDADVFVRDRVTGQTQPASRSVGPGFNSYGSDDAAISADGRYVAFTSDRAGLVQGDTNQTTDVFRFDRQTRITTRVSVSSAEEQSNFGSGDIGAGPSVSISGDGRYVAFISQAWNLVPDDTNQGFPDIFIRDTVAGTTSRIPAESVGSAAPPNLTFHGLSTPEMSQDGRFVAYTSLLGQPTGSGGAVMVDATDVYLTRIATGATTRASGPAGLGQARRGISIGADGGVVAFSSGASDLVSGDTNGAHDVFLRNTSTGAFTRIAAGSVSG
ncbi:MAG: PD40 domain-containing protein, partial [Thermoleophilaceae bacterium]|nr:PD40 domain-containing protein [Thermoleophilaceae bacterium]